MLRGIHPLCRQSDRACCDTRHGRCLRRTSCDRDSGELDYSRSAGDLEDLFQNFPVAIAEEEAAWRDTLAGLASSADLAGRLRQSWSAPSAKLQDAGRLWLKEIGLETKSSWILPCPGLQSALGAAFDALSHPGETLALASLGHPMVADLARQRGLSLLTVEEDDEGLIPESLDRACKTSKVSYLYYEPTFQNPTATLASAARREQIAEVAARHDLLVIEEDFAGHYLSPSLPTLASLLPERALLLVELWQTLSLGLRVTFLLCPSKFRSQISSAAASRAGLVPSLEGEVAVDWISTGVAKKLLEARARELEARHRIVEECLPNRKLLSHPQCHHLWLELPPGERSELFVYRAEQAGVAITDGQWFRVNRGSSAHGVRICHGNATDRQSLSNCLARLEEILRSSPRRSEPWI